MTHIPTVRELQPLVKGADRRPQTASSPWQRLVATVTSPDLIVVAIFCAIGFLVTVNVVLRFPDFAASVEQLEQFP
jgi:hypothetical protein